MGDVDNDPHTPKSNGSLKSGEKSKRKGKKLIGQNSFSSFPNTGY